MKSSAWPGLCVLVICCAGARAETPAEVFERLAKGEAEVRDLAVKWTWQTRTWTVTPDPKSKETFVLRVTGVTDLQWLRDGARRLTRSTTAGTRQADKAGASFPGSSKADFTELIVADGEFLWREGPDFSDPRPHAAKFGIPSAKPQGDQFSQMLDSFESAIRGSVCPVGGWQRELKDQLKGIDTADMKVVGKGNLLGRPTTIIECVSGGKGGIGPGPIRSVTEYDDATGTPLAVKASYVAAGGELYHAAATEIKVNTGLRKALFTYAPPAGAEITDHTKGPEPPAPAPKKE